MDIISTIISNLDLMYIVSCNAATYFIIKMIEGGIKSKKGLGTWHKRLAATLVAIGMGFAMYYGFQHTEVEPLFYGFFIQFLTWDYLFKPLMKMLPGFFSPTGMGPVGGGKPEDMDP